MLGALFCLFVQHGVIGWMKKSVRAETMLQQSKDRVTHFEKAKQSGNGWKAFEEVHTLYKGGMRLAVLAGVGCGAVSVALGLAAVADRECRKERNGCSGMEWRNHRQGG